ncbi:SDR family oxidoreductase [Saccharopolyspora karakumensis]|uniref:SDR family oxidoreductase n=1 Tax=Saccharopolyspora karakumensis TaxID=2530386 RepID=A0A4R5BHE5_9PSEU|nr:UDP-glucuronic acid decarboxylase family protein [Saccharopolyspora karakumensis]TDD83254.1 SDR family oxidoreductase [Saccharopolyspora karakumensis]
MRVVITGGAGFIGAHLCEALLDRGTEVVCVDNLVTGSRNNIAHLLTDSAFSYLKQDVSLPFDVTGQVDAVAHLASPASPVDYHRIPLETLAVGSRGTEHALQLAKRNGARFLLASTSEVYGDPLEHPQQESYPGNVDPVGPRSVYDEAKRFAEALSAAYRRSADVNTGIVRIFNTYGPRMRDTDGRVVSNFITQALDGRPLTIYGDGSQTRSLCHVGDLVRGLLDMLSSPEPGPVNLGNPEEITINSLAETVRELTGSNSEVEYRELPVGDPVRRRPVIDRARHVLGWSPTTPLEEGLRNTIEWFRTPLSAELVLPTTGPETQPMRATTNVGS